MTSEVRLLDRWDFDSLTLSESKVRLGRLLEPLHKERSERKIRGKWFTNPSHGRILKDALVLNRPEWIWALFATPKVRIAEETWCRRLITALKRTDRCQIADVLLHHRTWSKPDAGHILRYLASKGCLSGVEKVLRAATMVFSKKNLNEAQILAKELGHRAIACKIKAYQLCQEQSYDASNLLLTYPIMGRPLA